MSLRFARTLVAVLLVVVSSESQAPRRGTDPRIQIMKQQTATYATLEGKEAYDHPNTDAANGLTGTETITWALRRP